MSKKNMLSKTRKLFKQNTIVYFIIYMFCLFSLIRDQILAGDFSTIVKLLQVIQFTS